MRQGFVWDSSKSAHYAWPVLGNWSGLHAALDALDWENAPVAPATSEISRDRIVRILPCPEGTGFQDANQAVLIERYTTHRKNGQWRTHCEAIFYITSLTAEDARRPARLQP